MFMTNKKALRKIGFACLTYTTLTLQSEAMDGIMDKVEEFIAQAQLSYTREMRKENLEQAEKAFEFQKDSLKSKQGIEHKNSIVLQDNTQKNKILGLVSNSQKLGTTAKELGNAKRGGNRIFQEIEEIFNTEITYRVLDFMFKSPEARNHFINLSGLKMDQH